MKGPSIHVKSLGLNLGNSQILTDISFEVEAGTIHSFIGPNGGGKTSAIRCLLGQMPHTGSIQVDWDVNRTIGYVPQLIEIERTLPLNIDDFLAIVSQDKPAFTGIHKSVKKQIDEALERVGLTDKRRFMIGSLSGGERQRLLFAQALIPSPALLVLDEPMTSLDEAGAHIFEQLITDLNQEGTTVLWVNHDLKQVQRMAHNITVIDRGVLASGATTTTLTEDMQHGVFHPNRTPSSSQGGAV